MSKTLRTLVAAIAAFVGGDTTAVAQVWTHFESGVVEVVTSELKKSPENEDVCDVVNDTFIAAFKTPPKNWTSDPATDEIRFRAWIRSVARNRCQEFYRARNKWRTLGHLDLRTAIPDLSMPLDEALAREELNDAVLAAVALLMPAIRNAVWLKNVEGLSAAAAAEVLNTSPGAVRVRCSEAKASLRAELRAFA